MEKKKFVVLRPREKEACHTLGATQGGIRVRQEAEQKGKCG